LCDDCGDETRVDAMIGARVTIVLSVIAMLLFGGFIWFVHSSAHAAGYAKALAENQQAVKDQQTKIDQLAKDLQTADAALIADQSKEIEIQTKEVVKYVTQYREVIKDRPVIVDCINDSGLLELINNTMPTSPGT
jgi:predicted RND superfamily exporter protein